MLSGSSGDQVSCYTTVGGGVALLKAGWGLEGCSPFSPLRTNRSVRFDFSGLTVLVASSGDQVSFNTTGGGGVLLKDIHSAP